MIRKSEESLKFGTGEGLGRVVNNNAFDELDAKAKAVSLAYIAGCPIPEQLVDGSDGRGADKMVERYGEVGFWFNYLAKDLEQVNPTLYKELVAVNDRKVPVGIYEPQHVPDNYAEVMYPLNNLAGFALPRVFLVYLDKGNTPLQPDKEKAISDRMEKGLSDFEKAAKAAKSPIDLVAMTSERLAARGADKKAMLGHILGSGWLDEHKSREAMRDAMDALAEFAPSLWECYVLLTKSEKADLGLV